MTCRLHEGIIAAAGICNRRFPDSLEQRVHKLRRVTAEVDSKYPNPREALLAKSLH